MISEYSWLVPLMVLLPLVGAGLTLAAAGRTWIQRMVSISVLTGMLVVASVLLSRASGRPMRRRPQAPEEKTYVRSCLSRPVAVEA